MRTLGIGFNAAADFEPVHARHHHVEQHDIGIALVDLGKGFEARIRRDDLEVFCRQLRFEKFDIRQDVVDDKDTRRHDRYPMKRRTVSRKLVTEMGFEM